MIIFKLHLPFSLSLKEKKKKEVQFLLTYLAFLEVKSLNFYITIA